jgi:dihydrofolate reductase
MNAPTRVGGLSTNGSEENQMRKIVAGLYVSLDGVVEAPETWHFPYLNEEMREIIASQLAAADTMLLGRRTYEVFAAYWPDKGSDIELADQINSTRKLVASTTLESVEWRNSSLIKGDVAEELRRLKQEPGRDISITGSATLVRSLLRAGVLDELRLLVHPIIVGSGERLFADSHERMALKLLESRTLKTGVLYLTYAPADA